MITRHIGDYHFVADARTGLTMRWGKTVKDNPPFAPVPELADISISNHCSKGCSFCYRDSSYNQEWMSLEDYRKVLDGMNHPIFGNVFQVALGGGEPLEHPFFTSIIKETVTRGIVPNFTTNGVYLTESLCRSIQGEVGAVAISTTSIGAIDQVKISMLRHFGIETNIHYVLSSKNITEAIGICRGVYNEQLENVNALIFLTYKPAGRADDSGIIKKGNLYNEFMEAIGENSSVKPKIGFDACFIPMLLSRSVVNEALVDCCDGGFFSVYIDHKMNVSPCSFSGIRDVYSLREYDFYDIWTNKLDSFRKLQTNQCQDMSCKVHSLCRGCCPYYPEITLCYER